MSIPRTIPPGATLGVLGGGQLGRMFAMAAARMGYRTIVLAPERDCPASQVASDHVVAHFDDEAALRGFARRCDAVTIEFENVPVSALDLVAGLTVVRPGPAILATAQDRIRERAFLSLHGFPCPPFAAVRSAEDVLEAAARLGAPAVLKRARSGYDGRGQARVHRPEDAAAVWTSLCAGEALYETWVQYRCEISVLVARSSTGETEVFGPIENHHVNHVLDLSVVPARVPVEPAIELAREIALALKLEGLMCVEMFVTDDGSLLVNELAPRPHNSGHLTIEACEVSQFEQQVRVLCGLPLRPMTLRSPAAMVNLLGDLWRWGEPAWERALTERSVVLHLYGKSSPGAGRKMGHLTALGGSAAAARRRAIAARALLTAGSGMPESAAPLPEGLVPLG